MDRKKQLLLEKRRYGLKEVISDFELNLLNQNIPIQKIMGFVEMANVRINIQKFVLIPRYETEELVLLVLKKIKSNFEVLDLCCGSGFIGIALKKNSPHIKITLSDISDEAIEQTKENLQLNNVDGTVIKSNLFENLNLNSFDLIVCNPPYLIDTEQVDTLVTDFEPKDALFAKDKGLFFYNKILNECFFYLKSKGEIWFEINPLHLEYWENSKMKYNLKIYRDIANLPRFVRIVKDEKTIK